MTAFLEELLIDCMARLIGPARHVAVGAASPIPAFAAFLAQQRGSGMPRVFLQQSPEHNPFTDGGRELFDLAGQGRIDVFFLSGAQIDGNANLNLVALGEYDRPTRRFPGSFGSAYLYFVVPRVILFRVEHARRTLVDAVDFISAPGTSPPNVYRPGGPVALVTGLCVFAFDKGRGRFRLDSIHPEHSLDEVRDHTGFDFDLAEPILTTPTPDEKTLSVIRGMLAPRLRATYPAFCEGLLR